MRRCHKTTKKINTMQKVIEDNNYIHLAEKLQEHNSFWKTKVNIYVKNQSPINRAVVNDAYECFDILIKNGADINDEKTFLAILSHICAKNDYKYFDEIYKNPNLDIGLCFRSLGRRKFKIISGSIIGKLLNHPNINNTTINCDTIDNFIGTNQPEWVYTLFDPQYGIKMDSNVLQSGLCTSIRNKNYELVEFFISQGANVNKKNDHSNQYPINDLCFYPNINIFKLLLKNGLDCNLINYTGENPMLYITHYVYNYGMSKQKFKQLYNLTELLIENGSDVKYKNKNNLNPIRCAIEKHCYEFIELFIKFGAEIEEDDIMYLAFPYIDAHIKNPMLEKIINILIENGCNLLYQNESSCLLLKLLNIDMEIYYRHILKNINLFDIIVKELKKIPIDERKKYLVDKKYPSRILVIDNNNQWQYKNVVENILFYFDYAQKRCKHYGFSYTRDYYVELNNLLKIDP